MTSSKDIIAFRRVVWAHYKKNGRHDLPWRKTHDPYKILVSEMMLQQTQVPRVIPKYKEFLKTFPTIRALAKAPLSDVLKVWSGLGYNRRAKYLHDAAKIVVSKSGRNSTIATAELEFLPGVGPYTRSAVKVFAFNESELLIETNVRTAIIHHFLGGKRNITDAEIERIAAQAAVEQDPREWHSALFDYGAYLKSEGVKTNAQSAGYVRQSSFKGSLREVRGAILKALHAGRKPEQLPFPKRKIAVALVSLKRDGLI